MEKNVYKYDFISNVRNVSIAITNINFCAYMPKLECLRIAYAPNLTNLKGLQQLNRMESIYLFNCTGLKDLHDLDAVDFVQNSISSGVTVQFTDNVKYAFTDFNFGPRVKSTHDSFWIVKSTNSGYAITREPVSTALEIESLGMRMDDGKCGYTRCVCWNGDKVTKDYTA